MFLAQALVEHRCELVADFQQVYGLNLLALAVIAAGGLRVGLLAVLPALVLARAQGVRGDVVGTVLGTVAAWIDLVIAWEPLTQQDLPRLLLLPIVLATGWSALVLEAIAIPLNPMSATLGALVIAVDCGHAEIAQIQHFAKVAIRDRIEAPRDAYDQSIHDREIRRQRDQNPRAFSDLT